MQKNYKKETNNSQLNIIIKPKSPKWSMDKFPFSRVDEDMWHGEPLMLR